ncbi:MAG: iron-sulfur cluster-binding protein [Burkholderiales bacterium RIFOXYC12_FULL_65_23]|jgi:L-lactate dehydrogenase complex protein LldF|uniref:LutB/LldF family L-lactate oxidation iron-sulfur protein n=1 Tax=Malikia spinosa TaxID=86180 RepID=UPI0008BEA6E9|nr:LutB/LldF family L-lactate oxidation iron-sulfur protein [Malikia spinosa]OGB71865.1 MAG: iron-sulfur cluster-binding protein [Burkholderiales bacterium RIFOXYC12_FULL_65_23]
MQTSVISFHDRAQAALDDPTLKIAIDRTTGNAEKKRAVAVAAFPQFEATRDLGKRIKDHVVANLDHYLLEFERNAIASGAKVHWAATAEEASRIVVELCQQAKAKRVTRVKSMLGEEIGLPHALDEAGFERYETDLAEHIVQLAGDRPSHIVWPSMHRTREQVSALFKQSHQQPHTEETIEAMVESARRELRDKFLTADVAISGANFLIADSGATCTVTNEGNAELTTSPPRVHIVTAGIEKLVPSLPHAFSLLRLLVRSATGAEVTQYTTFHCGPKQAGDLDGPEEFHIVLVDNGRSKMLADASLREMLRCIRCGACMNHCVVFRQLGGHAYGGTYPGPMGAVLTPVLDGLEQSRELAHACTLNGKCQEVCPVQIPLPTLLRGWRDRSWRDGLEPTTTRIGLGLFTFVASRPWLYRLGQGLALRAMRLFGRQGWISRMPGLGAWTRHRDFPVPEASSFMAQYQRRKGQSS